MVTNLCVLKFDDETHEMYLAERYEGVTPEQVQENTGFALDVLAVDGDRAADAPRSCGSCATTSIRSA